MVSSSNFISFISVYTFGVFYFLIIHEYTISILLFNLFFDSNLKLALDDFFALGRQLKGNIFSDLLPILQASLTPPLSILCFQDADHGLSFTIYD